MPVLPTVPHPVLRPAVAVPGRRSAPCAPPARRLAGGGVLPAVAGALALLLSACSTLPPGGTPSTVPPPVIILVPQGPGGTPATPSSPPPPVVPPPPTPTPAVPPPPIVTPPAPPTPRPTGPVSATEVRAVALRVLPPQLKDRSGWADDFATSFAALGIPAQAHKVCAIAAVIEQESTWQPDPPVANLAAIAKRELDKKREAYGIPEIAFDLALLKTSPTGRTYRQRLDSLRTERELSNLFEDMIREIPMGATLFAGQNPVRTGGATQVSIAWAAEHMRDKPYPWRPAGSAREEVFKRRGGLYFGAAMLLDYPVSYNRMIYRFADFNAGRYASRNAAVQTLLTQLTGQKIAPDGDLLRYQGGKPVAAQTSPSQAWRALMALPELDLSPAQIERDLKLEKRFEFEQSATYLRLYALAQRRGLSPAAERLPDIALNSPKITRKLTTAWFAERVEGRYRTCLARDAAANPPPAVVQPPAWVEALP